MRQRRQIARGADRSLARDHRQDVPIEKPHQRFHGLEADAGSALREGIDLEQQDGANDRHIEGSPDARCMRTHDIELQRGKIGRRDALLGELAEAGIDAIDSIAGGEEARHSFRTACDLGAGLVGEFDGNRPGQHLANHIEIKRSVANTDAH